MGESTKHESWNRGDGQPDPTRLDEALDRVLQVCSPVEVVLFGSAARGELGENSDIDLLVVLADGDPADPRRIQLNICEAIGYRPRADVVVAFKEDVRKAARSLAGVLRTAREEGVALYRQGRKQAYEPRQRPEPIDTDEDRQTARWEAERLWQHAQTKLQMAEACVRSAESSGTLDWYQATQVAGDARKAVELALQAVIVAAGRRPRAWKDPAGLASEAQAAGATVPAVDPGALERAANHYTGSVYPGYPSPSAAEALEALELARRIVPWARESTCE